MDVLASVKWSEMCLCSVCRLFLRVIVYVHCAVVELSAAASAWFPRQRSDDTAVAMDVDEYHVADQQQDTDHHANHHTDHCTDRDDDDDDVSRCRCDHSVVRTFSLSVCCTLS